MTVIIVNDDALHEPLVGVAFDEQADVADPCVVAVVQRYDHRLIVRAARSAKPKKRRKLVAGK